MAQIDNTLLLGIAGFVGISIATAQGVMLKIFYNYIKDFSEHKKIVMYKATCDANLKGVENSIENLKELFTTKFDNLEDLIKNGGNPQGRIRT